METSTQVLEEMNEHRLNHNESKIYFSEKILVMSLKVLKVIARKTNYSYPLSVFKLFNKTQRKLISYLKMKYPRGGPTFVPGDLAKKFQNFNMVENPDNDILRNARICFFEEDEKNISLKLKVMFNSIIEELNSKFPKFQALLQEKVFVTGENKQLNYKIGRKLPETISKFNLNDDVELTITAPEIFRVIIKWVDDMEEYLTAPDEEVN